MCGPTGLSLAAVSPSSRSLLLLSVTTYHAIPRLHNSSTGIHTTLRFLILKSGHAHTADAHTQWLDDCQKWYNALESPPWYSRQTGRHERTRGLVPRSEIRARVVSRSAVATYTCMPCSHHLSPRHSVPLSAAHWAVLGTTHDVAGAGLECHRLCVCTRAGHVHLVDCQVNLVVALLGCLPAL